MRSNKHHKTAIFLALACIACTAQGSDILLEPLENLSNRPTPLFFGLHVTPDPEQNPIDPPERFTGYHVGLDYEVSAKELDEEIPVFAVCDGKVLYSGFAEGYGGLLVHRCRLRGEDVTVMYGHLTVEGLPKNGSYVTAKQKIGTLAPARSEDSGGNRKHLHFGIHRGRHVDMRGYVQTEAEINDYINPVDVISVSPLESIGLQMKPYWETESEDEKD